jgi:GAF domain-containing protein
MVTAQTTHASLRVELSAFAARAYTATELMTQIVERLNIAMLRYNWVGFYLIERRAIGEGVLALGPFAGTINTYAEIPLGQGVCGVAATSGETILVTNVAADPRYISRDQSAKSELVVPIFVHGKIVGILDVNSHFAAAFDSEDRQLCEHAAELVGRFIASHSC